MKQKVTAEAFLKSKCAKCLWLKKVDKQHVLCPFKRCIKDDEDIGQKIEE